MKKLLLFFLLAIFVSHFSTAQYKINKLKYDPRTYTPQSGDPYNPTLAGLESLLIPGLGQLLSGEPVRGGIFFGSWILLFGTAYIMAANTDSDESYGYIALPIFASFGILIASIVDAVEVAKVNSLAFRDQNGYALKLEIKPYLRTSLHGAKIQPNLGLTLGIKF